MTKSALSSIPASNYKSEGPRHRQMIEIIGKNQNSTARQYSNAPASLENNSTARQYSSATASLENTFNGTTIFKRPRQASRIFQMARQYSAAQH